MEGDVLAFAQVMTVIMGSLAALVAIGFGGRILWRLGSRVTKAPVRAPRHRAELEQLQTAVEAIAIEVERISEAQRFTLTLLSDRLQPPNAEHPGELAVHGSRARVNAPR